MTVKEAFMIHLDPNSKPAQKGAATKILRANYQQATEVANTGTATEEQKMQAILHRIIKLV